MRVLFDSCVYDLRNKGNVAMLQTAVNRIHDFWPEATLNVITSAPYLIRLYFPNARPVSEAGIDYWTENRNTFSVIFQRMPRLLLKLMLETREPLRQRVHRNKPELVISKTASLDIQNSPKSQVSDSESNRVSFSSFNPKTLEKMDLYIATGGHYLADHMNYQVLAVLDRLELATQFGMPTIMVSQGIGPIKDPRLCEKARSVLPKVDLFLIRENLEGPGILKDLGVDPSRVIVAGDDAVEMTYKQASRRMGKHIGLGFRVAPTTEATAAHMDVLRLVLREATAKYKCQLIGLPVSQSAHELDRKIIEHISTGSRLRRSFLQSLSNPSKVIKDTGLCRVVITGTYHTAVFALSQGIPVIGLVKSDHYHIKFTGLADQFKGGMEVFLLDDDNLHDKLLTAIDKAWKSAGELKPSLLQAAERQIKSGLDGYKRIYEIYTAKHETLE